MQANDNLMGSNPQPKPRSGRTTTSNSPAESAAQAKQKKARDALIAGCVANFGVQYNFTILAIALLVSPPLPPSASNLTTSRPPPRLHLLLALRL